MNPSIFWQRVEELATSVNNKLSKPFRAKAMNVNTSGVQIQTYDADTPLGERYAQLRGSAINAGDEVAVIPYGGSNLVLGAIGSVPNVPETLLLPAGVFTTETTSHTGNIDNQPLITRMWTLPQGAWRITLLGSANLKGPAQGSIQMNLRCNGWTRYNAHGNTSGDWRRFAASTSFNHTVYSSSEDVEVQIGFSLWAPSQTVTARDTWFLAVAERRYL